MLGSDTRRLYFEAILIYKVLRLNQPDNQVNFFTKYRSKRVARGALKTKELSFPKLKYCGAQFFQFRGTILYGTLYLMRSGPYTLPQ